MNTNVGKAAREAARSLLAGRKLLDGMRRASVLLVVVWLALVTRLHAATTNAVDLLVAQGRAYEARFDNTNALAQFREAYALAPTNAVVLTGLVASLNNVGEDLDSKASEAYFAQAVNHAAVLRAQAPGAARTWFLSAVSKGNLTDYRSGGEKVRMSREVRAEALRALELDADFAPGYVVLGVYNRKVAELSWAARAAANRMMGGLPSGTFEDARAMFEMAIEKEPENLCAYYELGVTCEAMKGKRRDALAAYRKVLLLPVRDHEDAKRRRQATARIKEIE